MPLKKWVTVQGKNITTDQSVNFNDAQKKIITDAGFTLNAQPSAAPTPAPVTPPVQSTPTQPVATPTAPTVSKPREYISPRLQERINSKTPAPVTPTQIANAPIDSSTGAPQLPEQPKQEIKPLETTKTTPTVQSQAEVPKNTPEVLQNKPLNLEAQKNYNEGEDQKVLANFQAVLQANPNDPKLDGIIKGNPALRDQMKSIATTFLRQQRAQKIASSLSLKNGDDLKWAVQSGTITPWTEDWETLSQANPQLIQEYNQKKQTETKLSLINGTYSVDPFDPKKQSGALLSKITEMQNSQNSLAMYEQFMSAPEIQNTSSQILWVDQELITVSEQIQGIDTSVRETLPAWVPESIIAGEVANRQKGLYQKVTALESRKSALIENYNRLSEQAMQKFQVYQQDQKQKMDFMMNVYGITRQEEIRYEDLQRSDMEYQRQIERSDYEYQRAIEREDYTTARNIEIQRAQLQEERGYNEQIAMENTLLQMGVDPTGMDKQTMYATLSQSVREQQQQQAILAQQENQIKAYNAQKGNWKLQDGYMINQDTGEYQPLSQAVTSQWLDTSVVSSLVQQCRTTWQCGAWANDYLQNMGETRLMGDTYKSKTEDINSQNPVVGWLAVWNPQGNGIGHVGIVVSDNGDTVTIHDWNWWNDEKQQTHEVSKASIANTGGGYVVPKKIQEMYQQAQAPSDLSQVRFNDKATEFAKKSFGFGTRMNDSEKAIDAFAEKMNKWYSTVWLEAWTSMLPNFLKSDERQQFEQAQRNFVNSVLRQESGAAIADSEFENAKKQYFPMPWDSKAVMDQKKQNRMQATRNMFLNAWKDSRGIDLVNIYENSRNKGIDNSDPLWYWLWQSPQIEDPLGIR